MEELGIGRPSTYASIIQVLQDRNYVRLEARRFVPEDRGRVVIAFLSSFFERYIEYDFTADLEQKLDDVSNGRLEWRALLRDFWRDFIAKVDGIKDLTITQVIDTLDEELGTHFFPAKEDGSDPRQCPACAAGRLGLRLGKHGAFIGCSNYPRSEEHTSELQSLMPIPYAVFCLKKKKKKKKINKEIQYITIMKRYQHNNKDKKTQYNRVNKT